MDNAFNEDETSIWTRVKLDLGNYLCNSVRKKRTKPVS